MPIEYPILELRNEDNFAAEAIGKVTGLLTEERINSQIVSRQKLLELLQADGLPEEPICPELTNANPASPHTVLLETQAWMLGQMAYRLNQVPTQNLIAFANLFGIEPISATYAETSLRFTITVQENDDVTIPVGTTVSDVEGKFVFETFEALVIEKGESSGEVLAVRTETGQTLLSPEVLTVLIDNISFVESVTNPNAIDSGTEAETVNSILERVNQYQRRGERIVTAQDLEEAILDEALLGNGIVKAFPFVANGDFASGNLQAGYTSVVVMTTDGNIIDNNARSYISELLTEVVGNQFVYISNPEFVNFNISCTVRLRLGAINTATRSAIEANLRKFYAPAREQFGRAIYRSEIISIIEGTEGVERIEAVGNAILTSPLSDTRLAEYQLPRLVNININVI